MSTNLDATIAANAFGVPVLTINGHHDHWTMLKQMFWYNGNTEYHHVRNNARAHIEEWRPEDDCLSIIIYAEDNDQICELIDFLAVAMDDNTLRALASTY